MADQPLCSVCGKRESNPDLDSCMECFNAEQAEEHFHGDTDTQWLDHASDEEIRQDRWYGR